MRIRPRAAWAALAHEPGGVRASAVIAEALVAVRRWRSRRAVTPPQEHR